MNGWIRTRAAFSSLLLSVMFAGGLAAASDAELCVTGAGPRQVEPTLQQSIPRDYVKAWQTLSAALESGDPALLDRYWVGVAHDKFHRMVEDRARTGVQVRYKDTAHQLQAVFYPADGAALLLYDTVHVEIQIIRSGKIIDSEETTEKYLVLMTPAQDRWLVRVFQSIPLS